MTKTIKTGMNAKTGAAVVIEAVSKTFVPSNVTALVRVFSDMKKHVSKELKNEQSDVKALTIQAVIVVADILCMYKDDASAVPSSSSLMHKNPC